MEERKVVSNLKMDIRLVTYVAAGTTAGVVDGPAAGSGGATAAVVERVDVLFEDSVFFKTVFILISSFFPTLFTLSSRPSAGAPPTLEAMSVNVQVRWSWSQRRYVGVLGRSHVVGCNVLFHIFRSRYSHSGEKVQAERCLRMRQ